MSAKRPRKWAGILDYAASFMEPPRVDLPVPPVQITLPNGTPCSSTESEDLDAFCVPTDFAEALLVTLAVIAIIPPSQ